jgi:hypothetical protein
MRLDMADYRYQRFGLDDRITDWTSDVLLRPWRWGLRACRDRVEDIPLVTVEEWFDLLA